MDSDMLDIIIGSIPTLYTLILGGMGYYVWRRFKKDKKPAETEAAQQQGFVMLQQQIQQVVKGNEELKISNEQLKADLTEKIQTKLGESQQMMTQSVQTQFQESQRLIKEITEELGNVRKTGEQVVSFTEQLRSLQDVLQNSKQRGTLGEYFLETTIKNIMPPDAYEFQYKFNDGMIVDCVIKLPEGLVPIDSKFSLENYNKLVTETVASQREILEKKFYDDLKLRINETAKYIRPEEGTLDFAFMFIPAEGIYYDLLVEKVGVVDAKSILEYAYREKKVIVVSPTTLHAYLQTVIQGLNSLKIEKQAGVIIKKVADLQKHLQAFNIYHEKLGSSLGTVVNHYNQSAKEIKKISQDSIKITGEGQKIELPIIDKPQTAADYEE